jgi:plastocyanin
MNETNKIRASTNSVKAVHLPKYPSFLLLAVFTLSVSSILLLPFTISHNVLAQNQTQTQLQLQKQGQQPNIHASYIYQTQTIVLGKNIKNLVILIPNEGHEDPAQTKGMRVINQPYIPQNAVVNVGTIVTWLNADAGHRHSISLVDNNTKNVVFNSGRFDNFNASKPFTFNNVGIFAYSGPSYDRAFPNYKMNGTVTVVNQPLSVNFNTTSAAAATAGAASSVSSAGGGGPSNNNIDTITTLMVPSKLLDKTIADLKSQGFTIDNQYPFTSLRGGRSAAGGDKQQVLLVLTSSGKNLNQVISALANVASTLPYK